MAKKQENYLEYVPVHGDYNTWDVGENGLVTVHMVHRGAFAWIAQTVFNRPRISHIDLDEMGSFLFRQMDGQRTVGQLADLLHAEFGERAEPLYDRLVQYMKILYNNGFIRYANRT